MEPELKYINSVQELQIAFFRVFKTSKRLKDIFQVFELKRIAQHIDKVSQSPRFGMINKNSVPLEVLDQDEIIENILLNFYCYNDKGRFQDNDYLQTVLNQKKPDIKWCKIFEQTKELLLNLIEKSQLSQQYLDFCMAFGQYRQKDYQKEDFTIERIKQHLRQGVRNAVLIRRECFHEKKIYGETLYSKIYVNTYEAESQKKQIGNKFDKLLKVYYFVILIHQLTHYILRKLGQINEGERSFDNKSIETIDNIKERYQEIKGSQYNLTWDLISKYSNSKTDLLNLLERMKPLEQIYQAKEKALMLNVLKNFLLNTDISKIRASTRKIAIGYYENGQSLPKNDKETPAIQKLKQLLRALLENDNSFKELSKQQSSQKLCDQDFKYLSILPQISFILKDFKDANLEGCSEIPDSLQPDEIQVINKMEETYFGKFSGIKVKTEGIIREFLPQLQLQKSFFLLFVYYRTYKSLQQLQKQLQFYEETWQHFPEMFKKLLIDNLMQVEAGYIFEAYLIPSVAKHSRIYESDAQILENVLLHGNCSGFKQFGSNRKNDQASIVMSRSGEVSLDLHGAVCGVPFLFRKRGTNQQ